MEITPVLEQGELEIALDNTLPTKSPQNPLVDDESISSIYLTFDSILPSAARGLKPDT